MGTFVEKCGKGKNYHVSVNERIIQHMSLGRSAYYYAAQKQILYLIFCYLLRYFFTFALFILCFSWWLMDGIVDVPLRCMKTIFPFIVVLWGLRHMKATGQLSLKSLLTNPLCKKYGVSWGRVLLPVLLLFWLPGEIICGIGQTLSLLAFFSCLNQTFPLLRRLSKKFPDWKAFLWKTSWWFKF